MDWTPDPCNHAMQELRVALKGGEQRLTELADAKPDALQLTHKLAYSFLDSMLQSSAPLTMRPQQQALCAVCHALVKYGMTRQAVLERYAAKATGGALNGNSADVVQALDVRIIALLLRECHSSTATAARVCLHMCQRRRDDA
jgi:hypothetical protein